MTHTSGLGYPFTSAILRDFKPRPGEDYPIGPLLFEPGTRWHYGTSTDWLGKVVEAVAGGRSTNISACAILGPLGMADTFYNVPADKQARLVAVHHRGADGIVVKDETQPGPTVNPIIGGGGLASTAADYIRFVRMILNDGELDGARILKADTVAAMGQNQIGALGVPALKIALPRRSDDFSFIADGRDKWGLGFLITVDDGRRQALRRQPELGRHLQHLFLDRPQPRHRRRDPDPVPAVRRPQGACALRRLRTRRLSARRRGAVAGALAPARSACE